MAGKTVEGAAGLKAAHKHIYVRTYVRTVEGISKKAFNCLKTSSFNFVLCNCLSPSLLSHTSQVWAVNCLAPMPFINADA